MFHLESISNSVVVTTMLCSAVCSLVYFALWQICRVLCESTDPALSLKVVQSSGLKENLTAFNQANVKASRKAVLPIIQNNLEKLQSCLK